MGGIGSFNLEESIEFIDSIPNIKFRADAFSALSYDVGHEKNNEAALNMLKIAKLIPDDDKRLRVLEDIATNNDNETALEAVLLINQQKGYSKITYYFSRLLWRFYQEDRKRAITVVEGIPDLKLRALALENITIVAGIEDKAYELANSSYQFESKFVSEFLEEASATMHKLTEEGKILAFNSIAYLFARKGRIRPKSMEECFSNLK